MPDRDPLDLPLEVLPEMISMLERNILGVRKHVSSLKTRPVPKTQMAAAELLYEFQGLKEYQSQVFDLEAQRDVWLAGVSGQNFQLELFMTLLEQYKTTLSACVELALTLQAQARALTGFEGIDERWRDPLTGQLDHPIGHMPFIAEMIQQELEEARSLEKTLLESLPKPHILDDETLDRIDHNYGEMAADNLNMHGWQLERWLQKPLTDQQKLEVQRLKVSLEAYRVKARAVLALSQRLRAGSIDRVMEKSDLELGIEFLLGKSSKPAKEP